MGPSLGPSFPSGCGKFMASVCVVSWPHCGARFLEWVGILGADSPGPLTPALGGAHEVGRDTSPGSVTGLGTWQGPEGGGAEAGYPQADPGPAGLRQLESCTSSRLPGEARAAGPWFTWPRTRL